MNRVLLAAALLITGPLTLGRGGDVIATMDEMTFIAPKEKGRAEQVEGKSGKAVRFAFDEGNRGTFFTSRLRGTPEWDRAAGLSFWVKGDGGDGWGNLHLIHNDDFGARYDAAFPVRGADWTKVTLAWQDFVPVLEKPNARPLDPKGENKPSKVSAVWLGKWWFWGDYPAVSFALDDLRLEEKIERDEKDHRPEGAPLQRVLDKLKAGKPITIVTVGDSLTDFRHNANRKVAWPNLLRDRLKEKFKSDVTIVNPAVGGTELRQGRVLIPLWAAKAPKADLVTVCYGGNDWNSGTRGESFGLTALDTIDRVRRATGGKADVLIMTTVPSVDAWETRTELATAGRKAAAEKNAGLADTEKAFHDAGKTDRERLFVMDRVHLSPAGHELVAETVLRAIEAAGR